MNILISACLLGVHCRYDGQASVCPHLAQLQQHYQLIPVCPEIMGGLPTPRQPAELYQGRVYDRSGRDITAAFARGAAEVLHLAAAPPAAADRFMMAISPPRWWQATACWPRRSKKKGSPSSANPRSRNFSYSFCSRCSLSPKQKPLLTAAIAGIAAKGGEKMWITACQQ